MRICEIINNPLIGPNEALDEILWLNDKFSDQYTLAVLTTSAAKDLCLLYDMPCPEQVL